MSLATCSPDELQHALEKGGVDESTIRKLRGFDGRALLAMIEDFSEFKEVVSEPLMRVTIKMVVKSYESTNTSDTSLEVETGANEQVGPGVTERPSEVDNESTGSQNSDDESEAPPAKKPKLVKFDVNNIVLPTHFSRRVQDTIDDNELDEPDNRAAFVREVVAFFESILPNPTTTEYDAISKRVAESYPCLKDARTSKFWHTLSKQISQRYRNNRKRGSKALKKVKVSLPETSQSSEGNPPPTDDENAEHGNEEYRENVSALKHLTESGRSQSAQAISELLSVTREGRLAWLKTTVSIHDIMNEYPVLKVPKWLLSEFQQLVGEDLVAAMIDNWKSVSSKLLKCDLTAEPSIQQEVKALAMIDKNVYHRKPSTAPIEFIEATGDIEPHFKSPMAEPRLVIFTGDEGSIQAFLCAENNALMELPSATVIDALTYLMAAYYVFDVGYPKGCRQSLYFYQDFILKKRSESDDQRRPVRYTTFANSFKL